MVSLDRFDTFKAVVEAGSLTAAADLLGQTRAVVSFTIKRLEAELGVTLLTRNPVRIEPVTYWMRVGKGIVRNSTESRIRIFKEGLAGNIPDGLLVRVSTVAAEPAGINAGYQTQLEFLQALYGSLPESGKQLFVGVPSP